MSADERIVEWGMSIEGLVVGLRPMSIIRMVVLEVRADFM